MSDLNETSTDAGIERVPFLRFGTGVLVVSLGTCGDDPAVMIEVGSKARPPGEVIPLDEVGSTPVIGMLFPTATHADAVRRALVYGAGHGIDHEVVSLRAEAARLQARVAELEAKPIPNGKLVGWWNGIRPGRDYMDVPSIRWGADAEDTNHDIPLYDGYNPIHYQQPTRATSAIDLEQFRAPVMTAIGLTSPGSGERDHLRGLLALIDGQAGPDMIGDALSAMGNAYPLTGAGMQAALDGDQPTKGEGE